MKTQFTNLPISFPVLLFRHMDRLSMVLLGGLETSGNVNILTSYFAMLQHMEAVLSPYLDSVYYSRKKEINKNRPNFDATMQNIYANMEFLEWCSSWLKLMVSYSHKKNLMQITPSQWDENVLEEEKNEEATS